MTIKQNIFLIGPRACGKTSVGRALAARLGLEFVDTDHEFVASVGMEIAEYVARHGWDAFRDRETETLARVAGAAIRVVGCGGGIVLREENRAILEGGITLYLQTDPEELARRLALDPNIEQRPSLTGRAIVDEVRDILANRAPLYEACADAIVPQSDLASIVECAADAVLRLSEHF